MSDITHVLKAAATMGSEHLKLSMIFVVSHFLSAKVSPPAWMEVESGFYDPEIVSLSP